MSGFEVREDDRVARASTEPPDRAPVRRLARWTPALAPVAASRATGVIHALDDWRDAHERTWPICAEGTVGAAVATATALTARLSRDRATGARRHDPKTAERRRSVRSAGALAVLPSLLTIDTMWTPLPFPTPCGQGG